MWKNQGGDETTGIFSNFRDKLGMTQVSDADRTANKQFMQEQGIGRDPQTGRMYGGNWNEASKDFAGKNAPGTSMFGSANFGEMAQAWDEKYGDMVYTTKRQQDKQARIKKQAVDYASKLATDKAGADGGTGDGGKPVRPGGGGYRSIDIYGKPVSFASAPGTTTFDSKTGRGRRDYDEGGYMRSRYNEGGRVGILAAF